MMVVHFRAIVRPLHLKMYLVVAGKNVDGTMVDFFPTVVFLAGVDPAIANNLKVAPTAGAASFHPQGLVAVGIAPILQRTNGQKDDQGSVLAIHDLIAGEELSHLRAMIFQMNRISSSEIGRAHV